MGDLAPGEATALGHNYVGTEHLLLALLRRPEELVGTILAALRVDPDQVRRRVLQLMTR
ncbi:MAG: Clp protease N-terminal domain-containing protein [Acidimicrobiales bacterium]